jgi:hypothetical protein
MAVNLPGPSDQPSGTVDPADYALPFQPPALSAGTPPAAEDADHTDYPLYAYQLAEVLASGIGSLHSKAEQEESRHAPDSQVTALIAGAREALDTTETAETVPDSAGHAYRDISIQPSRPAEAGPAEKTSKTSHGIGKFLSMPWWAGIGAIAGVLAISGAIAAVLAILPSDQGATQGGPHSPAASPIFSEERMVSHLIAGNYYEKMAALIGAPPDFHKSLPAGRQLYVFDRRWEYIQLLVNDDTVLSVGVYAKTTKFKVTLETGTIVNGPPVGKQLGYSPLGAYGDCGASWFYYFQGYSFPAAGNYRSEIIGELPVTDTDRRPATSALCNLLIDPPFPPAPCIAAYYRSQPITPSLSSGLVSCIDSLSDGRATLANLIPSIVIVTAPDQPILPAMFNEDYFISGL